MSLRLIGAGLGRTGTTSLKAALELLLDGPCYHMFEVHRRPEDLPFLRAAAEGEAVDWHAFFDGWPAAVDWPTTSFWEPIHEAFPDSMVLLSSRASFDDWYRSATATIFHGLGDDDRDDDWFVMMKLGLQGHFTFPLTDDPADRDRIEAAYEAHHDRVRSVVPADRLIEWQPSDGWGPLCTALDLPVPEQDFPHRNTTAQFRSNFGMD